MLTDPDEDIREAAQDTIDQLQTDVAQPQAPGQMPGQPQGQPAAQPTK